jgi:hypothetical protein
VRKARVNDPSYRLHKSSGQGCSSITLPGGKRITKYFGLYGSKESKAAWRQWCAELDGATSASAGPIATPAGTQRTTLALDDVLLAYLEYADGYYRRPDGTKTSEVKSIEMALRAIPREHAADTATAFGKRRLYEVQELMVKAGLCRGVINQRIGIIKRAMTWANDREMIPDELHGQLLAVKNLKQGRAREAEPRVPVDPAVVTATLPHLPPMLAAAITVMRWTAARPSEILHMRPCELDRSRDIWFLAPAMHKTLHKGKARAICIGPQAQTALAPWLAKCPGQDAYIFSPARAEAERNAERSALRVVPLYPSHEKRNRLKRKRRPARQPGEVYDHAALNTAVRRACDRAFPLPPELAQRDDENRKTWLTRLTADERLAVKAWRKAHRWTPYQLRHLRATEIRAEHTDDAARAILGHSQLGMTLHYSRQADAAIAARVAKASG